MTILDELVESADKLCKTLLEASNNEKMFSTNVCLELERLSWQTRRMENNIKSIKEYCE